MSEWELPEGWTETEIKSVLGILENGKTINQGWSPQCEKVPAQTELDWGVLKTTAIQDGYFLEGENKKLPNNLNPDPTIEVNSGDILLTCAGPRNRCGVVTYVLSTRKRLMISGKMYRFIANPEIAVSKFLEVSLRSPQMQKKIDAIKTGGSDSGLNLTQDRFGSLNILLPPQAEQKRIVAKLNILLGKLGECRARLDRVPALLKRFRQSVLAAATSGKLTEDWREERGLPLGESKELGNYALSVDYGTSEKSSRTGLIPVLRMGNIQNGSLDWTDLVFTSSQEIIEKYRLENGDVLFNRTNSPDLVGKTAVYNSEQPAVFAGYLIRIKCSQDLLGSYLGYCLNGPEGRAWSWRVKTDGVSQSNINAKNLKLFELIIPTIQEQQEIVKRVESLFFLIDQVERNYKLVKSRLDRLQPAILAKAFRGELVPQDPKDEPAGVLLERIKSLTESIEGSMGKKKRKTKSSPETGF